MGSKYDPTSTRIFLCNIRLKTGVAAVFNYNSRMSTCLGKSCSLGLLCVSFVNFLSVCVYASFPFVLRVVCEVSLYSRAPDHTYF